MIDGLTGFVKRTFEVNVKSVGENSGGIHDEIFHPRQFVHNPVHPGHSHHNVDIHFPEVKQSICCRVIPLLT